MDAAGWIDNNFSFRTFAIGLAGSAVVIGALLFFAWLNGGKAVDKAVTAMPGQTVDVEWRGVNLAPVRPENHVAVDVVRGPDGATQVAIETPAAAETPGDPAADKVGAALTATAETVPGKPVEGLFETTQQGPLPIVRKTDGLTPFQAYRRPFDRAAMDGVPVVSLAVFDLGLSDKATEYALEKLPPDVSLIFSPYMSNPAEWIARARTAGREVWLSLPVEVAQYPLVDPGPQTALIGAAERENLSKLYWTLGRATNYVGFVTPPDPSFLKAEQDMRPLLTRIYGRGLGFIDGSIMPAPTPQTMAQSMSGPYSTVDIWIDAAAERESIADALAQVEKLALEQGFAAAVIRPYPLSYAMVHDWIQTLPAKGITLAPLSAQTGM